MMSNKFRDVNSFPTCRRIKPHQLYLIFPSPTLFFYLAPVLLIFDLSRVLHIVAAQS